MSKNKKIVVTQNMYFTEEDKHRLDVLGKVTYYNTFAKDAHEWLKRVKNADIILSEKHGLKEKIYNLHNVFISVPFVGISWLDKKKLKDRNITVANAPGCNKYAVSEWIIGMVINLLRKLPKYTNITNSPSTEDKTTPGLQGKSIVVLGHGNIGKTTGQICKAFKMDVRYFMRGDNLHKTVREGDIVINTLSSNPSTEGLLDYEFFKSMKEGSYFITVTSNKIYDVDALIKALNGNHLAGAASDAGSVIPNDSNDPYYLKLQKHPKILATPHIAARTEASDQIGNDIMIKNVEMWLTGTPINIVKWVPKGAD